MTSGSGLARVLVLRVWPLMCAATLALFAVANPLPGFVGDADPPVVSPVVLAVAAVAFALAAVCPRFRPLAVVFSLAATSGRAWAIAIYGIPHFDALHNAGSAFLWATLALAIVLVEWRSQPIALLT